MSLALGAATAVIAFIIGAVLRPFLTGYSTKKGENLATREDIANVVKQVEAVTRTTEEIKAEVSAGIWDRQKQWEMKRDVLFEASKVLALVEDQLMQMQSVVSIAKKHVEDPDWMETWHERLVEWRNTVGALERTLGLVKVVCTPETTAALLKFRALTGTISGGLAKKDETAYDLQSEELMRRGFEVRVAIRKELGVQPLRQSTVPSGAPTVDRRIVHKHPSDCSKAELDAFEAFVKEGGEVNTQGLSERILRAQWLVFLLEGNGKYAGIAALKRPNDSYKKMVFAKAGTPCKPGDFLFEAGWLFVEPAYRGKRYSSLLLDAVIELAGADRVYATTREDNEFMRRTNRRCGLVDTGSPYKSEDGDYKLVLSVR